MADLRLDARLRARLDASDVVQAACLDVAGDRDAYLADTKLPPPLWLRRHVGRRLTTLHRQHLGTRMRDAGLEISIDHGALPEAGSAAPASMLRGRHTSPTQAAQRPERMLRLREVRRYSTVTIPLTARCSPCDTFEQLGRAEAALALGTSQEAGTKRSVRAPKPLRDALETLLGGWEGL